MVDKKMSTEELERLEDEAAEEDRELTREDVAWLREKLEAEKVSVRERLDRHLAEAMEDTDNLPDEMDIATRQSEQAYLMRLADKEKKLLKEINHALAKFERGTYGICEGNGESIGLKRLRLRPWTRYSVEYKEKIEREKGPRR